MLTALGLDRGRTVFTTQANCTRVRLYADQDQLKSILHRSASVQSSNPPCLFNLALERHENWVFNYLKHFIKCFTGCKIHLSRVASLLVHIHELQQKLHIFRITAVIGTTCSVRTPRFIHSLWSIIRWDTGAVPLPTPDHTCRLGCLPCVFIYVVQVCPIASTIQSAVCLICTLSVLTVRPHPSSISSSINPTMHQAGEVYSH